MIRDDEQKGKSGAIFKGRFTFFTLGSLSNTGDDGYENVPYKKWIRAASNFIALIPCRLIRQMLAFFFATTSIDI